MQFVILVPLAWLPLLIIGMVVWEVVGDYLVTMLGWFVLSLVADVILYIFLMPVSPADAAGFAICLLLIPLLAPFVGWYVRYNREQERLEDLKRAERKRQNDLSYQKAYER
jgi:ABC-type transport system involved in cytochrome bd biosynthesis fused ATPase/permease subunit